MWGISWQEQHACPGNSAVPMVKTPQWFSAQERGNVDENAAALVPKITTERSGPPPHHSVIECQAPRN